MNGAEIALLRGGFQDTDMVWLKPHRHTGCEAGSESCGS